MRNLVIRAFFCALLCAHQHGSECPSGCECFAATHTVKCVSKNLLAVPQGIPGYARTVIITGNNIHRIGPGSFKDLENVTNLILSNNWITEVAFHSFSSLFNLSSLDLSSNHLSLIHPEALSIPGSPLQELNLSFSLHNSTSLTDLTTALRWGGLGGLLRLDLSANRLVLLPQGMFSHLSSLQHLLLGNNSLVDVYNGTFSGLRCLKVLDLTHNAFRAFRADALGELSRLRGRPRILLGHNPYACSCEIHNFAVWLDSSKAQVGDMEALSCASPWKFQGMALQGLGDQAIGCHGLARGEVSALDHLSLHTSYVLLGLVLGFVGMVFLFVLYLNRQGIKKWAVEMRDGFHDVLEGYHYRYEIDSDPRLGQIASDGHVGKGPGGNSRLPSNTCMVQIPLDTQLK